MVHLLLDSYFPNRIDGTESAEDALIEIPELVKQDKIDILILDMDMPGISGKDLLLGLAQKHISIPTVVFSGGQGNEESRELFSQIYAAQNIQQLQEIVENYISDTRGLAITYLPKEDGVGSRERLRTAVDAMLLAHIYQRTNLATLMDAMKISSVHSYDVEVEERKKVLSLLSDTLLSHIVDAGKYSKRVEEASHDLPLTQLTQEERESRESIEVIVRTLNFLVEDYCYQTLDRRITEPRDWTVIQHDFMGSRGLAAAFVSLESLAESYTPEVSSAFQPIYKDFEIFVEQAKEINIILHAEVRNMYEKGFGIRAIDHALEKKLNLYGNVIMSVSSSREDIVVHGSPTQLYKAVELAVINGIHAAEETSDPSIVVRYSQQPYGELHESVQHHFSDKGYKGDEEIVCIAIKDNGPGMPEAVYSRWLQRQSITSTKTGIEAQGLNLMRNIIEQFNDGIVDIQTSSEGTTVTFYFAAKKNK